MTANKDPILLIDDDYIDRMTVERAMEDSDIENELLVAGNGEEALEMLRGKKKPQPGIILLDINMPVMNGIEFLEAIKDDEELRKIPVIVLSTTKHDKDRIASSNLSVADFMVKPSNYRKFIEMFRKIKEYWHLKG